MSQQVDVVRGRCGEVERERHFQETCRWNVDCHVAQPLRRWEDTSRILRRQQQR